MLHSSYAFRELAAMRCILHYFQSIFYSKTSKKAPKKLESCNERRNISSRTRAVLSPVLIEKHRPNPAGTRDGCEVQWQSLVDRTGDVELRVAIRKSVDNRCSEKTTCGCLEVVESSDTAYCMGKVAPPPSLSLAIAWTFCKQAMLVCSSRWVFLRPCEWL